MESANFQVLGLALTGKRQDWKCSHAGYRLAHPVQCRRWTEARSSSHQARSFPKHGTPTACRRSGLRRAVRGARLDQLHTAGAEARHHAVEPADRAHAGVPAVVRALGSPVHRRCCPSGRAAGSQRTGEPVAAGNGFAMDRRLLRGAGAGAGPIARAQCHAGADASLEIRVRVLRRIAGRRDRICGHIRSRAFTATGLRCRQRGALLGRRHQRHPDADSAAAGAAGQWRCV